MTRLSDEHVSLRRTAEILGYEPKTLRNLLSAGEPKILGLEPTKILGQWRFPVSAIQRAIEQGKKAATGLVRQKRQTLPPDPRQASSGRDGNG